ncbi:HopJ type III effector protein [Aquimarina sp. 2201CG5-10]|uniref:HopJ type III effector protein n=1 Tax=Aquimarina callyspongiae TaxID=3098150 RepID=UPI002AB481F9|nr:HopJ type III effector protein [Aquimarina sp. 2201CG5-10]MDY8135170.1 HopJ type III effector protein [Aquimarina sp. 2201CG5-10]
MTIINFLEKLKNSPEEVSFQETMDVINTNYSFENTAFTNGNTTNEAGQNSGSCKLFSFAKLHNLTKEETLSCFGSYYKDVLNTPKGDDHQNIRNFMKTGWDKVSFEQEALSLTKN